MGALLTALLAAFAPILEQLLAGLGTYIMAELTKLFGAAAAPAKATEVVTAAERIASSVTNDAAVSLAWVTSQFPTFADLEAAMPGSAQAIHAKSILMSDVGVPHNVAAKAVEIGHANIRVAAAKP